ncbi:hypothetical protein [Wenxinia saemankumensis]|uniref:Phosphoadenosine phosphosulfate reductase n=1 Tax=Wenxinia saemankumensis TaxID=1447782 RepID=A0A1M6D1H3_9RHOB|nr:hypothetical protein [Wenxinia saemankumensis]SHI67132.1 hypothetical protein SAMN05444417_1475 [Wenxinia saemankumensis]
MLDDGLGGTAARLDADLGGLTPEAWRDRIDALGEEHGYFLPVGADHSALFVDAGRTLLVTFETVEEAMARPRGRPVGLDLAASEGWSVLTLLAEGETWFRSPAVTAFFDRQVDDGFFEDFDRVLFFGHHMGAYGAAAYSVCAPGCNVLLLRPVASLDPAVASWDRRAMGARRLDFASRYGFGPDMTDAARRVWTVSDPLHPLDAMHAALFRRPQTIGLRAPMAGTRLLPMLEQTGTLMPLLRAAARGSLTPADWGRLWRARRETLTFPRLVLKRAEAAGRPALVARTCRFGLTTRDAPLYAARARALGVDLAPPRAGASAARPEPA